MAKILIPGGEGALARSLRERAGRISLEPAFPGAVEIVAPPRRELDVTQAHAIEEGILRHRPDVLLYAAGSAELRRWELARWEAFLIHRDGADHAARACAKIGATMVYFSTDLVFEGLRRVPYREEEPPGPSNTFAEAKLAGELRVMTHLDRHLIVRSGWRFGPHHRGVVGDVVTRWAQGETVLASASAVRQPTYVEDFLDAVLKLVGRGKTGTYHVAPAEGTTELEVACEAMRLLGQPGSVEASRNTLFGLVPPYIVLDCSKLAAEGIVLPGWREGLKRYLEGVLARR